MLLFLFSIVGPSFLSGDTSWPGHHPQSALSALLVPSLLHTHDRSNFAFIKRFLGYVCVLCQNEGSLRFCLLSHANSLEKMLGCWERLKAGEGDNRGWDGWMASPTQWTWVWAILEDSKGQGSLACCSPWGHRELDMTEQLTMNNNQPNWVNQHRQSEWVSKQVNRHGAAVVRVCEGWPIQLILYVITQYCHVAIASCL